MNKDVKITIPKGSRAGKTLRLKNLGLPLTGDGFGNLNVKIAINIPENLSEQELKLYQQFYELRV